MKYKGKRMGGPAGPRVSQAGMLQQVQTLQEDMLKAQQDVAEMTITASAGGGAVTVVVTGERRLQSLTIAPEVVVPDDVEMLQDLIIAAVNEGLERVDKSAAQNDSAHRRPKFARSVLTRRGKSRPPLALSHV